MPVILTPQPDHEDRLDGCRDALAPAIKALIFQAVNAGWCKDTACMALSDLADMLLTEMVDDSELEYLIRADAAAGEVY